MEQLGNQEPGRTGDAATIVLGDYHHTDGVKARTALGGQSVSYPSVIPIWDAFDAMVRTQDFTICEMAITAFLQAHDAGKPLLLFPIVMVGGFHHRSIVASPINPPSSPADLVGKRVGVRSYSQTTGLWVRAILEEEYGVRPADINWVATEGSHSEAYSDPPNVKQTSEPLEQGLRDGSLSAAILGRQADKNLALLIPDAVDRERAWFDRHGLVPINHMVVTTLDALATRSELVRAYYAAQAAEIDATRALRTGKLPSATEYGTERVRAGVSLAAAYAFSQGLISRVPDIDSLFVPPESLQLP
jgi:4,5-dihydroxyphthalate decarboxylase